MSFRRRRSGDFTSSIIEYNRKAEEEKSDSNDICESNINEVERRKKNMVKVKSNETISPDTTMFNQVVTLRSQVKSQQQSLAQNVKTNQTPKKSKRVETPVSPITEVLNKISKTLELKQDKEYVKPTVEICRQEPSKLWNALSNFNRSLNSDKHGVQSHQKVLSRLSQEFHSSPTKFAEKLVTIIEDSVMPSITDHKDCSGVSVRRMTQEFRKLCKFIEDESMPEWLMSPDPIQEEQIENQTIEFVDEISLEESQTFASTPIDDKQFVKNSGNSFKETPKGIFRVNGTPSNSDKKPFNRLIKDCRINDTNNSFEYWESMCNGVYLHQRVTPQKLRRSLSLPESPVTRLNNIKSTCERQMASLDDTVINENRIGHKPRNFRELTKDITCSPKKLTTEVRNPAKKKYFSEQGEELSRKKDTKQLLAKKQTPILGQNEGNHGYTLNCEDDMDKSFLAELAQRRQRCFETAKLMMEIDKNDPIVTDSDGKKSSELLSKLGSPNKSLSLPGNNLDFLNTINHCMEYQDFLLKKRKSIFNILKNPTSSDSNLGNTVESKKIPISEKTLISSVKSKTPVSKIKSAEIKDKKPPRRKFFVTPGKSPKQEETKTKKEYFPEMENILKVQSTVNIAKCPRTPEVRKNIYEYVRSPVAEYIKGTDTKLVKNIHAKNNDWLLTPNPLGVSNESKGNRLTPLKNIEEFSALKFNLSPLKKPENDENNPGKEFKFPKVDYKPSAVQMVNENCENETKNSGMRLKNLLKSCEKKVVIRHEGRIASPRKKNKETPDDIVFDTSVQVKTIARKTDSIRTRNVR